MAPVDEDRYFEAIEAGETATFEGRRTITEADVVNFAGVSGDFHPNHVSKTFGAGDSNFDGRVAHGNLVFAITEGIAATSNPKALSYGHDLRFTAPVAIGDTLSVRREIVAVEDYDETYGRVVYEYETTNQDGETVLYDEHVLLVRKESADE